MAPDLVKSSIPLAAEGSLGAWDARHSRVGFHGHAERAGDRFEDRFADVVAVSPVVYDDV